MKEFIKKGNIFKYIIIGSLIIPLIILIISPFGKNTFKPILWFELILCSGLASLVSFFYYIYHKDKNDKWRIKDLIPLIILSIFLIWTFISCLLSNNIMVSMFGDDYRKEGFITYIAYAGFLLGGILTKKEEQKIYFKLFVIVAAIISLFTMFKCGFTDLFFEGNTPYQSIFRQFNHFGYFLFMAIVCNINLIIISNNKKEKIFYFITYLITSFMLMLNNTLGCYLAVLGSMFFLFIYYFFIKKEKRIILTIIICIFVGISFIPVRKPEAGMAVQLYSNVAKVLNVNYTKLDTRSEQLKFDSIGTYRGSLWRQAIKLIKEKPITGHGLDNIRTRMYGNDRPHNMILQMSVYTGIPGMLLYVSSILMIVFKTLKKIKKLDSTIVTAISVVIGYIILSITANSMYYTSLYYMIFLGFCISNLLNKSVKN